MDNNLVMAIADFSVLLEFSDDNEINQDVAMKAMEQLGFRLQQMNEEARAALIECIESVSSEYGDRAEFVRALPDVFGLYP